MTFHNSQYRSITNRIHDVMLFSFVGALKASNLGTNYQNGRKNYYFSENRKSGQLALCDGFIDDGSETLLIEMKTKIVSDTCGEDFYNKIPSMKEYVKNHIAFQSLMHQSNRFLVVLGMYTPSQRQRFDFRDSKYLLFYGDRNKQDWSRCRVIGYWQKEFQPCNDISSLFSSIKNDSYATHQKELIANVVYTQAEAIAPLVTKSKKELTISKVEKAKEYIINHEFTLIVAADLAQVTEAALRQNLSNEFKEKHLVKKNQVTPEALNLLIFLGLNIDACFTIQQLRENSLFGRPRASLMTLYRHNLISISKGGKSLDLDTKVYFIKKHILSFNDKFKTSLTEKAMIFSESTIFKEALEHVKNSIK